MAMKIVADDLRFCSDCTIIAVNGDYTGLSHYEEEADKRKEEIDAGMARLAKDGHITPNFDSETGDGLWEFSRVECSCCGTRLAGYRARFCLMRPVDAKDLFDALYIPNEVD